LSGKGCLRSLRQQGLCEAVDVHIGTGEYHVQSFTLTAQDSGTAESPTRYIGEGSVVLHGGLVLNPEDFSVLTPQEKVRLQPEAAGNVIRYNYFHDLHCKDKDVGGGIAAIYFDDHCSYGTVEKNLFVRCANVLYLHGGHDMIFRNNLLIGSCENSVCSYNYYRYYYYQDLWNDDLPHPESEHWTSYYGFERDEEIWDKAYPHLKEYIKWDPETKQHYPHFGLFKNNIIADHKPFYSNFDPYNPEYQNVFENNLEIPSWEGKAPKEWMPEFEDIPFLDMLDQI